MTRLRFNFKSGVLISYLVQATISKFVDRKHATQLLVRKTRGIGFLEPDFEELCLNDHVCFDREHAAENNYWFKHNEKYAIDWEEFAEKAENVAGKGIIRKNEWLENGDDVQFTKHVWNLYQKCHNNLRQCKNKKICVCDEVLKKYIEQGKKFDSAGNFRSCLHSIKNGNDLEEMDQAW